MKRSLSIIFGVLLVVLAFFAFTPYGSEAVTSETVNTTLNYDDSYVYYPGRAADTIGNNDSVFTYKIRKKSLNTLTPYVYISLDSTGGTANIVTVTLESKVFPDEDYTVRETKDWTEGQDTVIILVSDTSHISEYWQLKLTGADDTFKAKLSQLNFKFVQ